MITSQLAGLATGSLAQLLAQMPPGNLYEKVAGILSTLTTDNAASGATQDQLQDQIDEKQIMLTTRFPIRLQNDVLSFGCLSNLTISKLLKSESLT